MSDSSVFSSDRLQDLIDLLLEDGYRVIGPLLGQESVTYGTISHLNQLPRGFTESQSGGSYRLRRAADNERWSGAFFAHVVGPHSWKRYLFPPRQKLWSTSRKGGGFSIEEDDAPPEKMALLGVRACELAAIAIQDRVFQGGEFKDSGYVARRQRTLLVAVDCQRAGETCFCSSLGTGPGVGGDCDIALTELVERGDHRFLARAASETGRELLDRMRLDDAAEADLRRRSDSVASVAASMERSLPGDAQRLLAENPEHPRWDHVAGRCLSCGNCTMVCPTCFCSTVEDVTSLDGESAERWRQWDSCFTIDFSHIHGGPVRRESRARYRHWITHKLSYWHEQFGRSGCTGCGRCITWCPVGIDITEEVKALGEAPGALKGGR